MTHKSNSEELRELMRRIGYVFKNPALLEQACTRRSYSKEHPESYDNEQLEFYGDKVIEFIIMKTMCERFGRITPEGKYFSSKDEGELTEIKTGFVCGASFAERAGSLDLEDFLRLGRGDIAQNVKKNPSVQEDFLEAIIGAVAIDCEWNLEVLEPVVKNLLEIEKRLDGAENTKKTDKQRAAKEVGNPTPAAAINQLQELWQKGAVAEPRYDFASTRNDNGTETWSCVCKISGDGHSISASAPDKKSAKKAAAYDLLTRILKRISEDK